MKKIVRLTEDDLTRIVKKVISEQPSGLNTDKGFNSNLFKDKSNDKGFNTNLFKDKITQKVGLVRMPSILFVIRCFRFNKSIF